MAIASRDEAGNIRLSDRGTVVEFGMVVGRRQVCPGVERTEFPVACEGYGRHRGRNAVDVEKFDRAIGLDLGTGPIRISGLLGETEF